MIYCFMNDTAGYRRATGLTTYASVNQGSLCIDDQMVNYLYALSVDASGNKTHIPPSVIGDTRAQRLAISVASGAATGSGLPDGKMSIHFDGTRLGGASFTGVTATEFNKLFNIIELLTLAQGKTAEALNTMMLADDANYGIYAAGSAKISGTTTTLEQYHIAGAVIVTPVVRNWVEFRATLNGVATEFKVWTNRTEFLTNYPFTTLTDIIYPCPPDLLLNLQNVENPVAMLQEASQYTNAQFNDATASSDNSGVFSFECKYVNNLIGIGTYRLYFNVVYQGRKPTREEARVAIKADLLAKTNTTDAQWQDLLPDLFTRASFLMVPIWSNYGVTTGNQSIKFGIYDHGEFVNDVKRVYPAYSAADATAYCNVMTCITSDVLLAVVPGSDNSAEFKKISAIHPTYMGIAATDPNFSKQAEPTQRFSAELNNVMGTLVTAGSGNVAGTTIMNGKRHLAFSIDGVDYYVLIKADYLNS